MAAGSGGGGSAAGADSDRSRKDRTPQGGTVEQAKEACLRLLAVRARSRAELAQRLAAKGYTPDITEQALARLTDVGLIDDAAFAEQWVHSRHTFSGKGKQALAQELRRKGVAQADAAPALESISTDDESARATELVRRKLRTIPSGLDREKVLRRLVGMLARRGYPQSVAFAVVKAELAGVELPSE
ncbi:recombination regulator RecX [Nocardia sp. NPDC048505]|uniref:recombination regulator RecX n=1 Tax=unclassified Nocardia TaxID=2637762 RepID=UPI0033C2478E